MPSRSAAFGPLESPPREAVARASRDRLDLVQETIQRKRLDEEMLRLEEQTHPLLARPVFGTDEHEPALEVGAELEGVLAQPQASPIQHAQGGDHDVEASRADRLQ